MSNFKETTHEKTSVLATLREFKNEEEALQALQQ